MAEYINGSNLLLLVDGKAVGHCTTHTITFNSDTVDRSVKPLATLAKSSGLWKGKGVTGLSVSVSAEGLRFETETESGWEEIAPKWGVGSSVVLVSFKRKETALTAGDDGAVTPSADDIYLKGKFVITSLEEVSAANEDATYSVNFENDGEPEVYPGKA